MKAMLFLEGGQQMMSTDVIEYEGQFWLVTRTLGSQDGKWRKPDRLVAFGSIPHQKTLSAPTDFVLNVPLPKALFDDDLPSEIACRYVVKEQPDITLPGPSQTH